MNTRLLDLFFDGEPTENMLVSKDQTMKCDIYEKDGNYNLEMDIPGFDKQDVKISFNNGYLTVEAFKEQKSEDNDKNYIRRERHTKKYSRSFYLGDIDESKIEAKFENGTLLVIAPKEEKEIKTKYIEIK